MDLYTVAALLPGARRAMQLGSAGVTPTSPLRVSQPSVCEARTLVHCMPNPPLDARPPGIARNKVVHAATQRTRRLVPVRGHPRLLHALGGRALKTLTRYQQCDAKHTCARLPF